VMCSPMMSCRSADWIIFFPLIKFYFDIDFCICFMNLLKNTDKNNKESGSFCDFLLKPCFVSFIEREELSKRGNEVCRWRGW
jgi:hypothetical protein